MLFCSLTTYASRNSSSGNATDCAECRAQSLKCLCLGLNLQRLIFQLEWVVSQKPQVGSRCSITVMSWWWVWKALLTSLVTARASSFGIKLLESNQKASRKINSCPRIPDGWWRLKFLFIKKNQPNQPNQIKHLFFSSQPVLWLLFILL